MVSVWNISDVETQLVPWLFIEAQVYFWLINNRSGLELNCSLKVYGEVRLPSGSFDFLTKIGVLLSQ